VDVGIAPPNAVSGTSGELLIEWARRADARGTVKQYIAGYEQAGCDELVFCPSSGDPAQVDLPADAAGL
jgi:hypothetical protein